MRAAVDLADTVGIESLSMRKLGQQLGVEAMSLYNHVANKEALLDGMVDIVVGEIELSSTETDWRTALRERILSARQSLITHPWASAVIESRINMSPTMISYMDDIIGIFRTGGFSLDLTHHALHALGSRVLGFTQELFDDTEDMAENPEVAAVILQQMTNEYPNISALLREISHEDESPVVGQGCDDQVEFEFGLDLILDGLERLRTGS